jgi:hypothetical protein
VASLLADDGPDALAPAERTAAVARVVADSTAFGDALEADVQAAWRRVIARGAPPPLGGGSGGGNLDDGGGRMVQAAVRFEEVRMP